jgi:hypothetical protein
LGSASASAREVKVGNSTVSVVAPAGYCEIDKTKKADTGWITSVSNLLNASGVTLIAAFPDCKELMKMRATGEFITTKVYVATECRSIGELQRSGPLIHARNRKTQERR